MSDLLNHVDSWPKAALCIVMCVCVAVIAVALFKYQ